MSFKDNTEGDRPRAMSSLCYLGGHKLSIKALSATVEAPADDLSCKKGFREANRSRGSEHRY